MISRIREAHRLLEIRNQIVARLMSRAADGAGSEALADEAVVLWNQAQAALAPILGSRSMTMLFLRALSIASASVPWLANVRKEAQFDVDLALFRAACTGQPAAAVAEGAAALFEAFFEVLTSLVGAPLTLKLLAPVRGTSHPDVRQDIEP